MFKSLRAGLVQVAIVIGGLVVFMPPNPIRW